MAQRNVKIMGLLWGSGYCCGHGNNEVKSGFLIDKTVEVA
jgi:hypothetical protein